MSLLNVKELIALDENLRQSENPPLYDLIELNPYEGREVDKKTLVTLNNHFFKNEIKNTPVYKDGLEDLFSKTIGRLPAKISGHVAICGGSVFRASRQIAGVSDIDVFLYNVSGKKHAIYIVKHLCKLWSSGTEGLDTEIFRTKNAITLILKSPIQIESGGQKTGTQFNQIQIILRLYKNIEQILYGFDIQCSALAMIATTNRGVSNLKVLGTELAMFSMATNHLPVDTGRRSETFPKRLEKYMKMGIILIFPFLDPVKCAERFANSGYRSYGKVGQRAARLKLKDAMITLARRIDDYGYEGYINIDVRDSSYTQQRFLTRDYDGDRVRSTAFDADWYNWSLLHNAQNKQIQHQPNLFLEVDSCSEIDKDIHIAKYFKHRLETPARFSRQYVDDIDYKTLKFSPVYTLDFRQIEPQSQWTTSFDPILESPQDWYGEFYTSEERDETEVLTYMFTPSMLGEKDKVHAEENGDSFFKAILGAESDTVEEILLAHNEKYNEFTGVFSGEYLPPKLSKVYASTREMLLELIVMNTLRNNGSLSVKDMKAIVQYLDNIDGYENWIDFEEDLVKTDTVSRNTGLFRNIVKRTALLNNTIEFCKVVHDYVQKHLRANKITDTPGESLKRGASRIPFKWQQLCRSLSKDISEEELKAQARYFAIDFNFKTSPREICVLLAKKTAEMLTKWSEDCVNSDEMTLDLSTKIEDLPVELKWTQMYNGRAYCYKLEDVYQSIMAGVKKSPRGVVFSEKDKKEIRSRRKFLQHVMTTYGITNQSLGERAMDKADGDSIARSEESDVGLATSIIELLIYAPMNAYALQHLSQGQIEDIAQQFYQGILEEIPEYESRSELLQAIIFTLQRRPIARDIMRDVLSEFTQDNQMLIDQLRLDQLNEQRERLDEM